MTTEDQHARAAPMSTRGDAWRSVASWVATRGSLPWLCTVMVAVAAIHWHVFDGEPAGHDLMFHFAESARIADCLRQLDFDLWNPSANAGYASAYYYQVLPQLASAIPAALLGHHLFFFQLSVLLPLVLAPACAYRGMRLLGATPWQAAIAGFVIAFMNGESRWGAGNAGTFHVGVYTQTWALCVFPLALGHGARWIRRGNGLAPSIGWGAFSSLCHPFIGVCLGGTFAIAVLCKLAVTWRGWLSPTLLGVLAVYLGAGGLAYCIVAPLVSHAPEFPLGAIPLAAALIAMGAGTAKRFRASDSRWSHPHVQSIAAELHRLVALGVALIAAASPVLLPIAIDGEGFGGFQHRVSDEVGPGFRELQRWFASGYLLDFAPPTAGRRLPLLTLALPVLFAFTTQLRRAPMRWLWPPAIGFALWLGIGPSAGKVGADLLPAVRALGALQTVLALAIGSGLAMLAEWFWNAPWDRWLSRGRGGEPRSLGEVSSVVYGIRTVVAAAAVALLIFVAVPGARALAARVEVLGDNVDLHRTELLTIVAALRQQPPGRKQVGPGAGNQWWNLLPYAYGRIPALLQMGGGGLQSSPNFDFLRTHRDYVKQAWIYDAPFLVFNRLWQETMPSGEPIVQTAHYEVRRLPAPGLVSPVYVVGILPPGDGTGELGRALALAWGKTSLGVSDHLFAHAGTEGLRSRPAGRTLSARRQPSPGNAPDIVAEVHATGPTTFCFRESWHPRWRAYIDGVAAPIRRVTPDFPAVDVVPGRHTLELRFERPRWALLIWLVWPGLILGAWLVRTHYPTSTCSRRI